MPNITPDRIGTWSEADIVVMLETGETPQAWTGGLINGGRGNEHQATATG